MPRFSGAKLRAVRDERGLSREVVAVAANVAASTLVRYEGEKAVPGINVACRLAGVLGVAVEDLLVGDPTPPAPDVSELPDWAQALIRDLRAEAAAY